MTSDAPTDINSILRASFEGAPAAPAPALAEASPANTDTVQPPPPGPAAPSAPTPTETAPDARLQKLIAAQQQARQEHLTRRQELTLAEQDRRDLDEYRALKARAKEDPVAWAEAGGYKPDEYAATLIDKGAMTPERRQLMEVRKELNELKSFRAEYSAQQERATTERNHALVVGELTRIAESDGEAYDLVKRVPGAYNSAINRVLSHYRDTGEELPLAHALQLTEQELLDTYFAPVADSPKIRARYAAPAGTAPSASSAAPAARQRTPNLRATSAPPAPMDEAAGFEQAGKLLFKNFKF